MTTFAVEATSIHPEHRERAVTAEFLVETGAIYSLLPAEIVERLELETEEDFEGLLASGEPVVCKLGDERARLGEETGDPVPGRGAFGELWHSRRGVILSVGTWMLTARFGLTKRFARGSPASFWRPMRAASFPRICSAATLSVGLIARATSTSPFC